MTMNLRIYEERVRMPGRKVHDGNSSLELCCYCVCHCKEYRILLGKSSLSESDEGAVYMNDG